MVAALKRRLVPPPLRFGLVWFENKGKIDFRAAEKCQRFQGRRCSESRSHSRRTRQGSDNESGAHGNITEPRKIKFQQIFSDRRRRP